MDLWRSLRNPVARELRLSRTLLSPTLRRVCQCSSTSSQLTVHVRVLPIRRSRLPMQVTLPVVLSMYRMTLSSTRRTAVRSEVLSQLPSRARMRLSSLSEREFSDVLPYTMYSTRLQESLSFLLARRLQRTLQTLSKAFLSSRLKSVQCLLVSHVKVSALSATDVTLLQAGWLRRVKLSESSLHSQSVSLVPSLHFVHSTSEVQLQVQLRTARLLQNITVNSNSRSSGLSRESRMTVLSAMSLSAVPPRSVSLTKTPESHSLSMTCLTAQSSTRRMVTRLSKATSSASGMLITQSPSSRLPVLYALTA